MAAFIDVDEVNFSDLDFSQFDVLLCKARGEKDLSLLREKQLVIDITDENTLALVIEFFKLIQRKDQFLNLDYADVSFFLLNSKKTIFLAKNFHYDNLSVLKDKLNYFLKPLEKENIISCNILVYFVSSDDLTSDAVELVMKTVSSLNDNVYGAFGSHFDESFTHNTLKVMLAVGVL